MMGPDKDKNSQAQTLSLDFMTKCRKCMYRNLKTTDQHTAPRGRDTGQYQLGKSDTNRESNQALGVPKAHYA